MLKAKSAAPGDVTVTTKGHAWYQADPLTYFCLAVLIGFMLMAIFAPFIADDPVAINPALRLRGPSEDAFLGRDHLGRDVFARAIFGARVSLAVGFLVAIVTTIVGVAIGLYAGVSSIGGAIIMRLNDALMAIPAVLLAIALASLMDAGVTTVIVAIAVPEVPRMVRLVRSVTLSVREQPYVSAAISIGTSGIPLVWRHILPNTLGPVFVQATYACASAIIASAVLSFLGVGTSPEIPSWGGMMADARSYFRIRPELMAYPGILLSFLVLMVNILGDRLSDALDPRKQKRGAL
ncbi:peptide/nickel transport system permease protein [Cohaesibacter sp. ES.047]|uniref:ABC transporter permease n=1 Tax=Cohaesibacter sp. ES.047 TaxID=1798205 RepID=UPI000BB82AFA|nr:ABC transporter permease [Cohaesibacter sp. ES.047]SNY90716.1 peptide/nickel transport system permease protein [Cohaesibacter sp. ES.047]